MSELQVLHLTTKLISLACLLQAIELLQLKSIWSKNTIWDWDTLKNNFSKIYQIILSPVLKDSGYYSLLVLTVLLSILGILTNNYYILPVLLVTSYLSSMRWGGSFNGGSDYMTILVLLTSTSAFLLPQYSHYIWIYLGVQVVLSYFISGVVKLKQPTWRSGESLLYLIQSSNYQIPDKTKHLITNKKVAAALSWVVIIFEISSPLVLLSPNICFFYLVIATTFHIANFYVFGLNRFIFAWLASYPALVYLTFMIH